MGKILTLYLSDEEAHQLKAFCDENQCTQYSALKIALKELLFNQVAKNEKPLSDVEVDNSTSSETPLVDEEIEQKSNGKRIIVSIRK